MYKATVEQLMAIEVPEQTRTYKPVSNKKLIELSLEAIDKSGLIVSEVKYTMAREGQQATGRYVIKQNDTEMGLMIGWQNSYNKSLKLNFSLGSIVFICGNGMIVTEGISNFSHKHQGDVQEITPYKIEEYIKGAADTFYTIQQDTKRFKEIEITNRTRAELIGRMYIEDAIITATQVGIIKKEIENPTHNYNNPNSMWELYNYSTFAAKEEHPATYFKTHMNIHKFFKEQLS